MVELIALSSSPDFPWGNEMNEKGSGQSKAQESDIYICNWER